MPTETYAIIPDAGVNVGFSLRLSAGVAFLEIDVVVPQMAAWSGFPIGYVLDWKHGVHILGLAHSLQNTNSGTVRIDISTDGVLTANTQQGAVTEGGKWFYGRKAVCL